MPDENVLEENRKRRFGIIFTSRTIPAESGSYFISGWRLGLSLFVLFFGIIAVVVLLIMYTPARRLLRDASSEQRYGREIAAIQDEMSRLMREISDLKDYDLRLRRALGEQNSDSSSPGFPAETPGKAEPDVLARSKPAINVDVKTQPSVTSLTREFPLTMPVEGYVSRGYDAGQYHYGIDVVAKSETPVLAPADGSVMFAGWTYEDGLMMMIAHESGYVTVYKHNNSLMKNAGMPVKRGEMVALLGNTGKTSSGPHLHFEIWKNGVPYDPANYLLMPQ